MNPTAAKVRNLRALLQTMGSYSSGNLMGSGSPAPLPDADAAVALARSAAQASTDVAVACQQLGGNGGRDDAAATARLTQANLRQVAAVRQLLGSYPALLAAPVPPAPLPPVPHPSG